MTITADSGPYVAFGQTQTSTGAPLGQVQDYNPQRGPSLFDLGYGMLDPRAFYTYQPGGQATADTLGFVDGRGKIDFVPSSGSSNIFVANTVVSTGVTTFTLAAVSNHTISTTIVAPETGKATGTLLALDSTAAFLPFGQDTAINYWNPGFGTGRCISITTSSSGDAGTYSIAGRDMYGYKMTETIALSQGTTNSSGYTITGQKAFKYISSITNTTTPTSTGISIGVSDTYGFPFKVPYCGQNTAVNLLASAYSSAVGVALSSANVALASTAATQTSTTPDVRGTYASSTASNAVLRLQMTVTLSASALAAVSNTDVSPIFGGTQYSSV